MGRTGAFIAMDRALEQTKEGVVDVMGIVNDMRQQRMKMVQTLVSIIPRVNLPTHNNTTMLLYTSKHLIKACSS